MQIKSRSKIIANVSVAMMLFIGATVSWANFDQTVNYNETYGLLDKILKTNESTTANFNDRYGNATRCNVKSCGTVRFTKTKVGRYEVELTRAGAASNGLDVQVMSVGENGNRCKVGGYNGALYQTLGTSGVKVRVICHDVNGNPADSRFLISTVGYYSRNTSDVYAAVWATERGETNGFFPGTFNNLRSREVGYDVETRKVRTGGYLVKLANWRATDVNSVRLTAVGDNSNFCTVQAYVDEAAGIGYRGLGKEARLWVTCYNKKGENADSGFSLLVEKSYKGPTRRGVQKTFAKKQKGAWTDWDFKSSANGGVGVSTSLANYNSTIVFSHRNYSNRLSFPFVTSLMPKKYCKIGSYKTRTISSTPYLDVKIRCYEANKGLVSSPTGWQFSSNLVSVN